MQKFAWALRGYMKGRDSPHGSAGASNDRLMIYRDRSHKAVSALHMGLTCRPGAASAPPHAVRWTAGVPGCCTRMLRPARPGPGAARAALPRRAPRRPPPRCRAGRRRAAAPPRRRRGLARCRPPSAAAWVSDPVSRAAVLPL